MRVQPRPLPALAVFVAYCAIVTAMWSAFGIHYADVGKHTDTMVKGVVVSVGIGAVFVAVTTSALGWWRPAMAEPRRYGPRWLLIVPVLLLVAPAVTTMSIGFSTLDRGLLLALVVGTLIVGFSEELLTRGMLLVGLRGRLSEGWVWFSTSALFGLLHGINALFGQNSADTVKQIGFAFIGGTAFYVTRMVTGTLIVGMLLHAFWDFSTLGLSATGGTSAGGLIAYAGYLLAFVGVPMIVKSRNGMPTRVPATVHGAPVNARTERRPD